VVALGGVSAWGAWQQSAREWNLPTTSACFALVFAVVVCTTVYFRLLGRMGWLLTQTIQIELESADQGEEESVPPSGKNAAEPTEPSIA
jgi:hypothetical protein